MEIIGYLLAALWYGIGLVGSHAYISKGHSLSARAYLNGALLGPFQLLLASLVSDRYAEARARSLEQENPPFAGDNAEIVAQLIMECAAYLATAGTDGNESLSIAKDVMERAYASMNESGESRLPKDYGDQILSHEASQASIASLLSNKRKEGVEDEDIRWWWNMHPLERALINEMDNRARLALFLECLRRGANDMQARAVVFKVYPLFGDPLSGDGDDRPLPIELKRRIMQFIELYDDYPQILLSTMSRNTTFNALVRGAMRNGKFTKLELEPEVIVGVSISPMHPSESSTNPIDGMIEDDSSEVKDTECAEIGSTWANHAKPANTCDMHSDPIIPADGACSDTQEHGPLFERVAAAESELTAVRRRLHALIFGQLVSLAAFGLIAFGIWHVSQRTQPAELRKWTDSKGKFTTNARLLGVSEGSVYLQKPSGRIVHLPIERLSDADREFLRANQPSPSSSSRAK